MKKLVTLVLMLLISGVSLAQEGEILYHEFDPVVYLSAECDQTQVVTGPFYHIDLDQNGELDFRFHLHPDPAGWGLRMEFEPGSNISPSSLGRVKLVNEGDTLSNAIWGSSYCEFYTTGIHWLSVRWQKDDGYYYGWVKASLICDNYFNNIYPCKMEFFLHDMAYCTIPDYPFVVGQTSFNWVTVDDNETAFFTTVRPNPTEGMFTVIGEDLQQAEVYNILGQFILSEPSRGQSITLNLSGQPAGIYLVKITDKHGNNCVKKIVKE